VYLTRRCDLPVVGSCLDDGLMRGWRPDGLKEDVNWVLD
jgi:hypothetical protein